MYTRCVENADFVLTASSSALAGGVLQLGCVEARCHAKPLLTASDVLATSPAANHVIQVGSSDVQGSDHVHFGLPARLNHGTCLQSNSAFICHPAAGPTVHQEILF